MGILSAKTTWRTKCCMPFINFYFKSERIAICYASFINYYFKINWSWMNKQQRDFDGSSIHGRKLKVSFKGDGVSSSSFVIERSRESSLNSLVFILPCIVAVGAVYQEFLSLTNFLVWTCLLLAVVFLKLYCLDVHKESVLVVKDLGVQFTRSRLLGLETSQFIEQHKIVDVVINEVITMHQVVFYLTLLTCDGTQGKHKRNQQLHPLFTVSLPCLETIKPIYHGMQQVLETRYK